MKITESKLIRLINECFDEVVKEELGGYGISKHMNKGEENLQEGINNQNYTHYAVNKATGKIVNGWDYAGYDPAELRQFKKDYFIADLIDNELGPKKYTILTKKSLLQRGVNPDDDANWANN